MPRIAKLPERFILPNGLRVLHQQVRDTRVVHLALILDVGSRDEEAHQLGMAWWRLCNKE